MKEPTSFMQKIPKDYVQTQTGEWSHPSRVAGLPATQPEQDQIPALDKKPSTRSGRKDGLALIVTLIRCSHRFLDDDNLTASFKGVRDSIATSLGVDDNDKRVRWEYGQILSAGRPGTMVKLTLI